MDKSEGGLGTGSLSGAVAPEPTKPGMSQEHKAKMAAGRERARLEGRMGKKKAQAPQSTVWPADAIAKIARPLDPLSEALVESARAHRAAPQPTANASGEPSLDDLERAVE